PMLDGRTGQQTKASALMQSLVAQAMPQSGNAHMVALDGKTAEVAQLIATGVITALPEKDQYRMNVAVTNRETGKVVATSAARFLDLALDAKPTAVFNDSPAIAIDQSVAGYIRTAESMVGMKADDSYLKQVPAAALLAQAVNAYNGGNWAEALRSYETALANPDGMQLRTLNGIYAAQVKLGNKKEAEATFGRIMEAGFANNDLAIKVLFKPNETSFWPDPAVSAQYPMWLRQIASASKRSSSCMAIIGHASRSGEEGHNRQLSLERATVIRQKIDAFAPGFAARATVYGAGSSENMVGTGKDDASDAIDRRVEFKLLPCAQGAVAAR
ncbi:MAG TPA: hypothetical protein VFX59_21810, partial [Polyangiales bacterium]|nr:hypothetical protein [Polyangiales bacterium]